MWGCLFGMPFFPYMCATPSPQKNLVSQQVHRLASYRMKKAKINK